LRQLHLDFHTSPHIPGVGAAFNPATFAAKLDEARVNVVNLFAKCHHGYSYHDTKIGERHPRLGFDLLQAQFDACKARGMDVQIYVSCGWDQLMTHRHPDWRRVGADGQFVCFNGKNLEASWHEVCFNTGYLDYLCDQISEVVTRFPTCDGVWLDILHQDDCCCPVCQDDMQASGLDWLNPDHRRVQSVKSRQKYLKAATQAARVLRADMPVFHNMGHLPRGDRSVQPYYSHWELESLPTGGWGYDHFPMSASFARVIGKPYLGMTGKFHTLWGEFGGFKHPNALKYETSAMLAFGAATSIGDQLHPSGAIDEATYQIIGEAFRAVEAKEPWCIGRIEPVVDIAIYSHQGHDLPGHTDPSARHDLHDGGAARVLLEGHFLFDMIDSEVPLNRYKLVVFPDEILFDDELEGKVQTYLATGGRILLTGRSGQRAFGGYGLDIGATWHGESPFSPDYVALAEGVRPEPVTTPMVMYAASQRLQLDGGRSLGDVYDPYFNRSPQRFCSHQHTPAQTEASGYIAGVIKGNVAVLAHPVFRLYREVGAVYLRRYIENVINLLLGDSRSIRTSLPSIGRVTVNRQPDEGRLIVHLLYAPLAHRGSFKGRPIEVIEDLPAIIDTSVTLAVHGPVRAVRLVPEGGELTFSSKGHEISFTIERFECHAMVEVEVG
jgi:hypothetical protein